MEESADTKKSVNNITKTNLKNTAKTAWAKEIDEK